MPTSNSSHSLTTKERNLVKRLKYGLRRGDVVHLSACLESLVVDTEPGEPLAAVIGSLSQTSYSELVRAFDPDSISWRTDAVHGVTIDKGTAMFTTIGARVDHFGIGIVPRRILELLQAVHWARRQSSIKPLPQDYLVLVRCAGAAAKPDVAKLVWEQMDTDKMVEWRQSEAYTSFIGARFLTEPHSYGHDIERVRVRPRDLHRSKHTLRPSMVARLDHLRQVKDLRSPLRFGQDSTNERWAVSLTRLLRSCGPVERMRRRNIRLCNLKDENIICALLIAFSRTGSIHSMKEILREAWGIHISRPDSSRPYVFSGGREYRPDAPLAPSAKLLHAVMHSFCCAGELTLARRLVAYVSRQYQIGIPPQIWSELFAWTALYSRRTVAKEWQIAGWSRLVLPKDALQRLWRALTSVDKVDFRPSAKEYSILVRNMISQRQNKAAIGVLRVLAHLHQEQATKSERIWAGMVQTMAHRVSASTCGQQLRAALVEKASIWQSIHIACRQLLKTVRTDKLDSDWVSRTVPDFILEFAHFIPQEVRYRTATGYVELQTDNPALARTMQPRMENVPQLGIRPDFAYEVQGIENEATALAMLAGGQPTSSNVSGARMSVMYKTRRRRRPVARLLSPTVHFGEFASRDMLGKSLLRLRLA